MEINESNSRVLDWTWYTTLMVDCFPFMVGVPDLLDKVQKIINKLRYRQHELEKNLFERMIR